KRGEQGPVALQRTVNGASKRGIRRRDVDLIDESGFLGNSRGTGRVQRDRETAVDAVVQHLADLARIVRRKSVQVDLRVHGFEEPGYQVGSVQAGIDGR